MKRNIILCFILVITLLSNVSLAIAATDEGEVNDSEQRYKNPVELLGHSVATENGEGSIDVSEEGYVSELNGMLVSYPNNGNKDIQLRFDSGETISIGLPNSLIYDECILYDNKYLIYGTDDDNFSVITQPTVVESDDVIESGFRTFIIINNNGAPHDYSFNVTLPDKFYLAISEEAKEYDIQENEIAVLNEGFLMGVFKAPWAKDANGKEIETYYTLEGNSIVQHVNFDKTCAFPIIADPWYGTSSKTEDYGAPFLQDFTGYPGNQPTGGYKVTTPGTYLGYTDGSSYTISVNVSLGYSYGSVPVSAGIGVAVNGQGVTYSVPVNTAGMYKVRVTKQYYIQRYIIYRRWKDSSTGTVTWREYGRNARKEGSCYSMWAEAVKQ